MTRQFLRDMQTTAEECRGLWRC